MTELSFLIDLLFEYDLPKPAIEVIRARVKEIEGRTIQPAPQYVQRPPRTAQSPSTQRILDDMANDIPPAYQPPQQVTSIPENIAQTPAAAAAMAARAEAIRIATSGVEEKGRRSPRKF